MLVKEVMGDKEAQAVKEVTQVKAAKEVIRVMEVDSFKVA